MNSLGISTLTVTAPTATITHSGSPPSNGDTVVIGDATYTFKTALTESGVTAYEVLIDAGGVTSNDKANNTLDNLIVAINGGTGSGTKYGSSTPQNTDVSAGARSSATSTLTGYTLVAIGLSTTASTLTLSKSALTGGTLAVGMTVSDATTVPVSRRVTIATQSADDSAFMRGFRISDNGVIVARPNETPVALTLVAAQRLAYSVNPALTWITQPEASSVTPNEAETNNTTFTVETSSELSASAYQWQYSTNGLNGWANLTNSLIAKITYSGATTATLTATPENTATSADNVYVRCRITTAAGTVTSDAVLLTINA